MVLGFDFGLKQIGVAVGQAVTRTASPVGVVRADNGMPDWAALDTLIQTWKPNQIVVGLPLNMDGTMSDMAFRAQKFAKRLSDRYHLSTHCMDERLSTHEAIAWSKERYHKVPEKSIKDTLAAVVILESFLSSLPL